MELHLLVRPFHIGHLYGNGSPVPSKEFDNTTSIPVLTQVKVMLSGRSIGNFGMCLLLVFVSKLCVLCPRSLNATTTWLIRRVRGFQFELKQLCL